MRLLLSFLLANVSWAAVAFDNSCTNLSFSGSVTTFNCTFTVGSGSNRVAMIYLVMLGTASSGFSGNVGGTSGSLISGTDTTTNGNSVRTLIFCVTNPPTGSQTATMSWTGAVQALVSALSVTGSSGCNNGNFTACTSCAAATTSVTVTSNNGDLTSTAAISANTWVAPGTNQTVKWCENSSCATTNSSTSGDIGPGTGTTTHTWSGQFANEDHAVSGANFAAVAAAGGNNMMPAIF